MSDVVEMNLKMRQQMFEFFKDGVIGTKEFRNWLAKNDSMFGEIRDPDVDNEIDELARRRREALEARDKPVPPINREGDIVE